MTDKRPSSTKLRREVFDANKKTDDTGRIYLECHICKGRIDLGSQKWDAEHVVPHVNGGKEVLPAHESCHDQKTFGRGGDLSTIAKGKRVSERHFGIKRSRGFYKPKDTKFDWSTGRYKRVGNEE